LITIDNICTRYHKLPSEILATASTFDLLVANTGIMWQHKQQEDAEADSGRQSQAPKPRNLTQQEMLDMIKRARERK